MADVFVVTDPSILIGSVELVCHGSHVALTPNPIMADISTWCDPEGEREAIASWTFSVELKQSYGTEGTWTDLNALKRTKVTVVVKPADATVSADNPSATFDMWMPSIPFIDAGIGESTSFTLEAKVIGEPVFSTGA